jgi:hypothetical protein
MDGEKRYLVLVAHHVQRLTVDTRQHTHAGTSLAFAHDRSYSPSAS